MVAVGSDAHPIRDLLSGLRRFRTLRLGFDFAFPFHGHQAPTCRFPLPLVVQSRPTGKRLAYPLRFLHFCLLAVPRESQTERFFRMMAISLPFPSKRNLWRSKDFHRLGLVSRTPRCPF